MKDKNLSLSVRFAEKQRIQEKNVLSPPKEDEDAYAEQEDEEDEKEDCAADVPPESHRGIDN